MKTIRSIVTTLSLLLTLLGTALADNNTNLLTAVRVNQRYTHNEGSVSYYLVFAQTKESAASEGTFTGADMESWGTRILDSVDKEFGGKIFKLKVPEHPTPKEKKIKETVFLPRAVAEADKWIKEQGLTRSIQLLHLDFDLAPNSKGSEEKGSTGRNVSAGGVTLGR